HQSDTYVFTMKMEILPVLTSNRTAVDSILQAGNPVKEILPKLNLHDHRSILTDLKDYIKMDVESTIAPGIYSWSFTRYFGNSPLLPLYESVGIDDAYNPEQVENFMNLMWNSKHSIAGDVVANDLDTFFVVAEIFEILFSTAWISFLSLPYLAAQMRNKFHQHDGLLLSVTSFLIISFSTVVEAAIVANFLHPFPLFRAQGMQPVSEDGKEFFHSSELQDDSPVITDALNGKITGSLFYCIIIVRSGINKAMGELNEAIVGVRLGPRRGGRAGGRHTLEVTRSWRHWPLGFKYGQSGGLLSNLLDP
ncbi:hypothetical protein Tco_0051482, partial [Tanacetum coccineum]